MLHSFQGYDLLRSGNGYGEHWIRQHTNSHDIHFEIPGLLGLYALDR
jgi:hypothetical protein